MDARALGPGGGGAGAVRPEVVAAIAALPREVATVMASLSVSRPCVRSTLRPSPGSEKGIHGSAGVPIVRKGRSFPGKCTGRPGFCPARPETLPSPSPGSGISMPAVSIVLLNQKGGVGKTSTCHHLAGTLAKEGSGSCWSITTRRPASPRGCSARRSPATSTRPDGRRGLRGRRRARADHPPDGDSPGSTWCPARGTP